jgi:hypothetical protein
MQVKIKHMHIPKVYRDNYWNFNVSNTFDMQKPGHVKDF